MPEPVDRFFEHAGARLRYRDTEGGPPLLLIHGWALDLEAWDDVARELAPKHRVLRADRRGFGLSSGTPDLDADAADLVALLDHLQLARAGVLGMSQGARVALRLAKNHPDRVACLVLDGTPLLPGLPVQAWAEETPLAAYRALLHSQGIIALRGLLASHPLLRPRSADPATHRKVVAMLERYGGSDLEATASLPAPDPANADLSTPPMPVLVLNGEYDSAQRLAAGAALAVAWPSASRRLVPRAGHLACLDEPRIYAGFVDEFVSTHLDQPA